ncbi:conserved hypothetical protein [Leishmania mexicana MHOM/GT/2001/U1103]|uniref:Uncharacterized protein n=1 Tax=Leishmania mexicana (strain MHOM/GT/2001/U1103) TaxID=929439 RepID=E9ATH2_LEIMU|nr:conserved hypothetical protein [Leishmania mexicana MHOM/GT/2001/U1103]CBZ26246.1 conserved hypothetical protein [Leishmania mexicana MHOM/GT/2001/U1103]
MLGEDLDIGFYAEDAYAAYVTDLATSLHLVPRCRNARGATLDVVFTGPFLDVSAYEEAVRQGKLLPYAALPWSVAEERGVQGVSGATLSVTLHGWIEKLNAARKVQLMEPLFPAADLCATVAETCVMSDGGNSAPCALASASPPHRAASAGTANENGTHPPLKPSRFRILGNLDFFLHLSSRDLSTAESSVPVDSPSAYERDQENSNFAGDPEDATRAAHACRDALEQRDDITLARNAVNTVIKFAQMAEEHPGEVGSVFVDAKERVEYIQFSAH